MDNRDGGLKLGGGYSMCFREGAVEVGLAFDGHSDSGIWNHAPLSVATPLSRS